MPDRFVAKVTDVKQSRDSRKVRPPVDQEERVVWVAKQSRDSRKPQKPHIPFTKSFFPEAIKR